MHMPSEQALQQTRISWRVSVLALFTILMVAAYLRIHVVLGTEVVAPLRADAGQYFTYAYNLRFHGTYSHDSKGLSNRDYTPRPDCFRNPGYPLMIAPILDREVTDRTLLNLTLFQAALSLMTVGWVYGLARRVLPEAAAWLVALLTAMSPHLVNANVYILSEVAASFTIVLLIGGLAWLMDDHRPYGAWLMGGVLLAITVLVRPTTQWFIVPLMVLMLARSQGSLGNRWQSLAWLLAGFLCALAPWWIRNLFLFGKLSDSSVMITTLHHGLYPDFMYDGRPETFGFPYRFDPRAAEISRSVGSVLTEIQHRFQEAPAESLHWYLLGKPLMFWRWSNDAQGAGDIFIYPVTASPYWTHWFFALSHAIMQRLHGPLVVLGMVGSGLVWLPAVARLFAPQALWILRLVSSLLLYFVVLHMIGAPFPRYSIPILPLLYLQSIAALMVPLRLMANPVSAPPSISEFP